MAAYIIRRLWQMVPTLVGVVLLVFILFHFFGADPRLTLRERVDLAPDELASLRERLIRRSPIPTPVRFSWFW